MYPISIYAKSLGLITASAVFFQFYVTFPAGVININLADPFALLALFTVVLISIFSRKMPQWRIAEFNWMLILFGVLLLFAYLVGWMKVGSTQWALSARLGGWLVLLGYLSAGYLLVTYIGNSGIRHMLEILVITAMLVISWQVVYRFLYSYGFDVSQPTKNFDGFSGNRNAFAFQLLSVLALSIAYSRAYVYEYTKEDDGIFVTWRSWVPLGFLFAGIVWTASRAGMLTAVIILILAYYKKIADRKSIFMGAIFAALLWGIVWALQSHAIRNSAVQSMISGEDSNQERWAIFLYGIEMWQRSPLIGEGLGVFMANSMDKFDHPTVIHSTPVWILAEFGLIGALVMAGFFLKLWRYSTNKSSSHDEMSRFALLLLLVAFFVFSQFHEMLFQRIIWLIGGVLLGVPLVTQHPKPGKEHA